MGGGSSFDRKNKYYSTKPVIEPYAPSRDSLKIDEDEPITENLGQNTNSCVLV